MTTHREPTGFSAYLADALMFFKYLVIACAAAAMVMFVSGVTI